MGRTRGIILQNQDSLGVVGVTANGGRVLIPLAEITRQEHVDLTNVFLEPIRKVFSETTARLADVAVKLPALPVLERNLPAGHQQPKRRAIRKGGRYNIFASSYLNRGKVYRGTYPDDPRRK